MIFFENASVNLESYFCGPAEALVPEKIVLFHLEDDTKTTLYTVEPGRVLQWHDFSVSLKEDIISFTTASIASANEGSCVRTQDDVSAHSVALPFSSQIE